MPFTKKRGQTKAQMLSRVLPQKERKRKKQTNPCSKCEETLISSSPSISSSSFSFCSVPSPLLSLVAVVSAILCIENGSLPCNVGLKLGRLGGEVR